MCTLVLKCKVSNKSLNFQLVFLHSDKLTPNKFCVLHDNYNHTIVAHL